MRMIAASLASPRRSQAQAQRDGVHQPRPSRIQNPLRRVATAGIDAAWRWARCPALPIELATHLRSSLLPCTPQAEPRRLCLRCEMWIGRRISARPPPRCSSRSAVSASCASDTTRLPACSALRPQRSLQICLSPRLNPASLPMSSAPSSSAGSEYWLLKVPNFLHESLEAQRKAIEAQAAARLDASNPFVAGGAYGSGAGARASPTPAAQPVAQLWVGPLKAGVRQMKLVVAPAPTAHSFAAAAASAPTEPSEFLLHPKPRSTMLVFGPEATLIAPAVPSTPDVRGRGAQESWGLAGAVNIVADAVGAVKTAGYQSNLKRRLDEINTPVRVTKEAPAGATAANPLGAVGTVPGMVAIKRKEAVFSRNAAAEMQPLKRTRASAEEIQHAILQFMSKPNQAFMTIARLALALNQPSGAISDAVKVLCNRQDDGPNKGLYGLKPEYMLASDVQAPGEAAGAGVAGGAQAAARGGGMFAVKSEVKPEIKRE